MKELALFVGLKQRKLRLLFLELKLMKLRVGYERNLWACWFVFGPTGSVWVWERGRACWLVFEPSEKLGKWRIVWACWGSGLVRRWRLCWAKSEERALCTAQLEK